MADFLSGGRIQGSSTADATPDITDTFPNADNWTVGTATMGISGNALNYDNDHTLSTNTNAISYRAITAVNDSKWTMTFTLTIEDYNAGGNDNQNTMYVGLASVVTSPTANTDFLGLAISGNNSPKFVVIQRDGGQVADSPTPSGQQFSRTPTEETLYVKMVRDGSNFTVSLYSDSTFETLLESQPQSISGTISDLDNINMITMHGGTSGTPSNDGKIENVKIYDGVTTNTTDEKDDITNVPANTRYEETDTRKIFRRVDAIPNQTKDAGTQSGTGMDTSYAVAKYISGLPAGGTITAVRIGVYNMSGNLKGAVYTTTGSGSGTKPDQKLAETGAESVSISNTNTDVVFDLTSSCTIPSNGIVWVGWFPDGNYKFTGQSGSASYLNSKHGSGVSGASYANAMPQTAWVGTGGDGGNGGNNLRAGVKYTIPAKWLERGVAS